MGDTHDEFSLQDERRGSRGSARRLSGASSRRGRPGPTPPQNVVQRARLNTGVSQGVDHATFSPLAQVYNPLLLDHEHNVPDTAAAHGISYGPATRRRLTSIMATKPRPMPNVFGSEAQSNRPNQPQSFSDKNVFPRRGILSASPGQEPIGDPSPVRATEAEGVEDDTGESAAQATLHQAVTTRLDDIERRQVRIESLLMKISSSITSTKQ